MRGHGRLLRGLTPAQTVDVVLGAQADEHTLEQLVEDWRAHRPALYAVPAPRRSGKSTLVRLVDEQQRTRRTLSVAWSVVAVEAVLLVVAVGLRLLGL